MPEATRGGAAARVMMSLKQIMKSRQVTYAELGRRIRLSEASMKRIFSRATLSLARLEQICQALDVSIQEVVRLAAGQTTEAGELLTLEQEAALAADPNLLACFRAMPAKEKRSVAVLLAVRPWVFSMFEQLRQPAAPPP
jgi:DNA-binding Xre family transcriptional regulator